MAARVKVTQEMTDAAMQAFLDSMNHFHDSHYTSINDIPNPERGYFIASIAAAVRAAALAAVPGGA